MNKQILTSNFTNEGFKPIAKLFLTGSNRVVTPWPLAKRESWLEESSQINTELVMYDTTIVELSELFQLDLKEKPVGRFPFFTESRMIDEESSIAPKALYGKIETNGTLSIAAFFSDGEDEITRMGYASTSNFEVEWLYSPIIVSTESHIQKENSSITGDQTK